MNLRDRDKKRRRARDAGPGATPQSGFSLIEMLVTIAVVAVISAISVAALVPLTTRSEEIVAKKNAQTIVENAVTAQAVDPDFLAAAADVNDAVTITLAGFTAPAGSGVEGFYMGLMTLDAEEEAAAKQYISFQGGRLFFNSNP